MLIQGMSEKGKVIQGFYETLSMPARARQVRVQAPPRASAASRRADKCEGRLACRRYIMLWYVMLDLMYQVYLYDILYST